MPTSRAIEAVLKEILDASPPRAGSMIVTVFGDVISQHGNAVWLGSVIAALEPFGLNPRQIRTAVFRLVQDGWLSCIKIGRRSYYSFTDFGQRRYEESARRIYANRPLAWDGYWTLVLPAFVASEQRERLRRELGWLGFGLIANGVLAHPTADEAALTDTLRDLGLHGQVITMRATTGALASQETLQQLIRESWQLDALELRYAAFIRHFRAVVPIVARLREPNEAQMFMLQTLLIHEYRRILLRTTDLPDALLPTDWSGREAMELAASLYRLTRGHVARFVCREFEGSHGKPLETGGDYARRF